MADLSGGSDWDSLESAKARRSFGGVSTALETAEGTLLPEVLLVGLRQAALHARWRPEAGASAATFHQVPVLNDVTASDDRGATYALRVEAMSGPSKPPSGTVWPIDMRVLLDPVPDRAASWLELRGQDGVAARLLPSTRRVAQVAKLRPMTISPAERELSELALSLIAFSTPTSVSRRCSFVLARCAELAGSGDLGATSELPGQLTRLCAALTEHGVADDLPPAWSSMLAAAKRSDGPRYFLDIDASLPPIDGVTVLIDSLFSWADSWQLYLRAMPGWWSYSKDHDHKRAVLSISAEDDRGGSYISTFGGSTGHCDHEEITLQFLPRLNPAARGIKLTVHGATGEVPVAINFNAMSFPG